MVVAFLLSGVAALAVAGVWGDAALIPFGAGEMVGALLVVLLLPRILPLVRAQTPRTQHVSHSQPSCISSSAGDTLPQHDPCPSCARLVAALEHYRATPNVRQRDGQVSPHFPGVLSPMFASCPPSRRPRTIRRQAAVAVTPVRASEPFGLLPPHVPRRDSPDHSTPNRCFRIVRAKDRTR